MDSVDDISLDKKRITKELAMAKSLYKTVTFEKDKQILSKFGAKYSQKFQQQQQQQQQQHFFF